MRHYRPLERLLDHWHSFDSCPCLLRLYGGQTRKLTAWITLWQEIHPWRTAIVEREEKFWNWLEWMIVHWTFTVPTKLKRKFYLFLSKSSLRLSVWESFRRSTPYAIGGTFGYRMYCYFSKKV